MTTLYGPRQRAFQDRFDTRRIADKIEALALRAELREQEAAFVESRDMFWLSSIDEQGRPTVSYKGGDPGFVRVLDSQTLAFPLYDGNGMFYSAGNIAGNAKVGMLFMDLERPHRLRIQGDASVTEDDPMLASFKEALLVVRVALTEVWTNCPRYVHRYTKTESSRYVPRAERRTPLAGWKRVDIVQDDLPAQDRGRALEEGGLISIDTWFEKVARGDDDA